MTPQERVFVSKMASSDDKHYAAREAGYAHPAVAAHKLLARPAVAAEIARKQQEVLFSDILPLAVTAHRRLLTDPKTPAGAVAQAVKLAYDRTLGADGAAQAKEPHEMTGEELAQAIGALERVAAARAQDVTPTAPEDPAESSIFA